MGKGLILLLACAWGWATAQVPLSARTYAPVLAQVQTEAWPDAPEPWTLAGLVEQESCITLTHSKCWNPRAELKTSREYGFGFGQVTIAYRADGTERFNKFEELRAEYPALRSWAWAERYRADYQLRAVVEMNRSLWGRFGFAASTRDRWAFTLSGYNGGAGGVLQDRRLCANTVKCDPSRWFGNIELNSTKSRTPMPGYGGRSPFDINRAYPRKVLDLRRDKYQSFWTQEPQ